MPDIQSYMDILNERTRQDEKWGEQNHPDGTGRPGSQHLADWARAVCKANVPVNDNWQDILAEEIFEAFAEADPKVLREELVQCAAVIVAWISAIDRRPDGSASTTSGTGRTRSEH